MPDFPDASQPSQLGGMNQNPAIIAAIIGFIGTLDYALITGLAGFLVPLMAAHPVAIPILFVLIWLAVLIVSVLGFRYLERLF